MEQIPEPDSDVAGMLIISDWKFKMTVINMLRIKWRAPLTGQY